MSGTKLIIDRIELKPHIKLLEKIAKRYLTDMYQMFRFNTWS